MHLPVNTQIGTCPIEYVFFSDSTTARCYKYVPSAGSWITAKAACQADGGAWLATIPNEAVQGFIDSLLADSGAVSTWIGLNDQSVEGSFVWDHGETVSYTNWSPSNPDNTDGIEACVAILSESNQWNDAWCSGQYSGYLCERNAFGNEFFSILLYFS